MPAKAGIQEYLKKLDSRFRGNDTGKLLDSVQRFLRLGLFGRRNAQPREFLRSAREVFEIALQLLETPRRPGLTNPAVPPALDDLVIGMLAKDPSQRPPTCDAVALELEKERDLVAAERVASVHAPVGVLDLAEVSRLPVVIEDHFLVERLEVGHG